MLDAGPQNFNKPSHIFITHSHSDHVAELPFTLYGEEEGNHIFNIYGPTKSRKYITEYIQAMFDMSIMDRAPVQDWLTFSELTNSDKLRLNVKNNEILVEIIDCDHGIPTISYIFSTFKNKLKKEYQGICGKEIAALRKNGVQVTEKIEKYLFSYVCDCSIETIKNKKEKLHYCHI